MVFRSVSPSGRFTHKERDGSTNWVGYCLGSESIWMFRTKTILFPCRTSKPDTQPIILQLHCYNADKYLHMGLGIAQYVQWLRKGLNGGWTVVWLSARATIFFLDGNKLGPGVQLVTNFQPVTKMRISGVIPNSSYTSLWCSQSQIYLLSRRTFLGVLRCTLSGTIYCSSGSLPLSGNYDTSKVAALQQVVLHTVTHLFTHITTARFSEYHT